MPWNALSGSSPPRRCKRTRTWTAEVRTALRVKSVWSLEHGMQHVHIPVIWSTFSGVTTSATKHRASTLHCCVMPHERYPDGGIRRRQTSSRRIVEGDAGGANAFERGYACFEVERKTPLAKIVRYVMGSGTRRTRYGDLLRELDDTGARRTSARREICHIRH